MYGKTVLKDGNPMNESIIDEKGSLKPGAFIPFENMKVIPKDYIKQSERKKILLIYFIIAFLSLLKRILFLSSC